VRQFRHKPAVEREVDFERAFEREVQFFGRERLGVFCSRLTRVTILPSRPIFLTRGDQVASLCPPLALVNSSTYTSPRCTATPVGDQGLSVWINLSNAAPAVGEVHVSLGINDNAGAGVRKGARLNPKEDCGHDRDNSLIH